MQRPGGLLHREDARHHAAPRSSRCRPETASAISWILAIRRVTLRLPGITSSLSKATSLVGFVCPRPQIINSAKCGRPPAIWTSKPKVYSGSTGPLARRVRGADPEYCTTATSAFPNVESAFSSVPMMPRRNDSSAVARSVMSGNRELRKA